MKYFIILLLLVGKSYGQNPYEIVVKAKNEPKKINNISYFSSQFDYVSMYRWKKGMKFMTESDEYNIGINLPLFTYRKKQWDFYERTDHIKLKDFSHKVLTFIGFEIKNKTTYLEFDCDGTKYEYEGNYEVDLNKEDDEEKENLHAKKSIDYLIYVGEIDTIRAQLIGKKVWVLSNAWMRNDEKGFGVSQIGTLKYYPATITKIGSGDKKTPVRIAFKPDSLDEAYIDVYLSGINSGLLHFLDKKLNFDSVFVFKDPKADYPNITLESWYKIRKGQVEIGMSEKECELSWGIPLQKNTTGFKDVYSEQWVYHKTNSSYLYFENEKLKAVQQ